MKSCMKHFWNNKRKITYFYCIAAAFLILSALCGILLGSTKLHITEILGAIFGGEKDSPESRIFFYVRLPRTCASMICGAALAVSGAVIQNVLNNSLASPSIIGVNSGAGLAVTLCSAFGIAGGWRMSLFAFFGAFITVMLVSLGAKKFGMSKGTVILMGVAINSLLGAVSDTVTTLIPEVAVLSNDFRIGDFTSATYAKVIPASVMIIFSLLILFTLSNELDVLTLGEENAKGLGLNTGVMRVIFLMLAAVLAGAAVSIAGLLSFVGLLVPHAVRRIASPRSKHLLPLCVLFGGGFVTLCDTLARVVFAPYEIPVGIIMAFLGSPFFIFLLIKGKGGHADA
ncbi:MAG: FecCD family ABC transporter permease [Eubacteriales bacterium]